MNLVWSLAMWLGQASKFMLSKTLKFTISNFRNKISELITWNNAKKKRRKLLSDSFSKLTDIKSRITYLKENVDNFSNLKFFYNKLWKEWFTKLINSFNQEEMLWCIVLLNKYSKHQLDEIIDYVYSDDMMPSF